LIVLNFDLLDGVIHDKSIIETLQQQQAANDAKNVKRENKAYSYKEQVRRFKPG